MSQWSIGEDVIQGQLSTAAQWNKYMGAGGNFDHITNGQSPGRFLKARSATPGDWVWTVPGMPQTEGTLDPDQKPATPATGDLFFATDFARWFRWNGTAWEDVPGQTSRGAVLGLRSGDPGAGWQICDGSTVNRSTPTGGVTSITVPDYTTPAYLKAKGAAHTVGPTAASGLVPSVGHSHIAPHSHGNGTLEVASHSHGDGTLALGGPDSTVQRDTSGTGVTVANSSHTHGISGSTASTGPINVSGSTASASPATDVVNHAHGPGTLELRNTELKAFLRL